MAIFRQTLLTHSVVSVQLCFNWLGRQQAILELLGQDFARLHFPHHQVEAEIFRNKAQFSWLEFYFQFDSRLLRPPNMDPKKREELLGDMRDLVDTLLIESLEDLGYPRDFSTITGKPDLESFLNGIRQALRSESENQVDQYQCDTET